MAVIEKLDHDKVKITVSVEPEVFSEAVQKAYLQNGKKYSIRGFRKGKAPRSVIEQMYGENFFFDDAFDLCSGEAYEKAVKENELDVVDSPQLLSIDKMSKEDGLVFTVSVQLKPEVKLGEYKGIEVEKPVIDVKEEDVDRLLKEEQEKNARLIDVDRPVENNDIVTIDYSGSVDGVKFEGGTAENQNLVIGSGTFIPGFEEQLIGMKKDEEKDINVRFPDEYDKKLAGKDAVFHIKLHSIKYKELPAIDDEFVKDISEFDTLEELKDSKRKELKKDAEMRERTQLEAKIVKAVGDNATFTIPDCMVDEQVENLVRDTEWRMSMSGISIEDYCNYLGISLDQMKQNFRPEAETRVRNSLVLEAVAKQEGITCSNEQLEEAIEEAAKNSGMDVEEFKKNINDSYTDYLKERKVVDNTVSFLIDNAKLVTPKKKSAKAPAKKAVTKMDGESQGKKTPSKKTSAKKKAEHVPENKD